MKLLKYILTITLIIFISSCDDFLNNPNPEQSLPLEGGVATLEDLNNLLYGAYDEVQDGGVEGAQSALFNEIMGDNTVWTGSFPTYVDISARNMAASNSSVDVLWTDFYDGINAANIILAAIPEVEDPNLTQEATDRIRGEALFIRALHYFNLVKYFALPYTAGDPQTNLGVPLRLEPVTSSDNFKQPARNTVAEVYTQIISDLQEAIGLLPAVVGPGRADSYAAAALLANVRMQQRDYDAAATLTAQVLDGPFELDESVTALWRNELTTESIFSVIHTIQDNPGVNQALTAFYNVDARDDIQISSAFVAAAEKIITPVQKTALSAANLTATDTRITELILAGTDGVPTGGVDNTTKYESAINTDDDVVVLRLPQIMLSRAEALTEIAASYATVPQEVFDLVNAIRRRAIVVTDVSGVQANEAIIDYTKASFTNKQELMDAIILERRIELAFEGDRVPTLQRRGLSVRDLPFDADVITFPIPQDEVDANPNIQQNPGYGGS